MNFSSPAEFQAALTKVQSSISKIALAIASSSSLANRLLKADGRELLFLLPAASGKAVFFDPQYRGVLDKMAYGNEGKQRGQARCSLPQMTEEIIRKFLQGIERYLKPSGYLFLWVDKFHIMEGIHPWLAALPSLEIVDMITWDKGKIGMGYRSRRACEYLVIIQKQPRRAKGTWTLHNIPDIWHEKLNPGSAHPHQKPIELQKQLILATTNEGETVLDPAAGSFSVFQCCKDLNRAFIGCDLIYGKEELRA